MNKNAPKGYDSLNLSSVHQREREPTPRNQVKEKGNLPPETKEKGNLPPEPPETKKGNLPPETKSDKIDDSSVKFTTLLSTP